MIFLKNVKMKFKLQKDLIDELRKLLLWLKNEPEFNIDDVDEILDDYKFYLKSKSSLEK